MKKSLIATGAASLALAAMPVVGVFAATPLSFTDNITVTVEGACSLETSATQTAGSYEDRTLAATIATGTYDEFGNSDGDSQAEPAVPADATITISCNTTSGSWTVTADGSDDGDATTPTAQLVDGANHINTGTATSGATSAWAFKMNADGTTTANPFSSYSEVPATATTALQGAATSSVTFRPSYRVYVSPTQAPGDYAGSVVYTISL